MLSFWQNKILNNGLSYVLLLTKFAVLNQIKLKKKIREFFDYNLFTNNSNQNPNSLNVPSTNNAINNIDSNIVNNNVHSNSGVFNKVFNFFLGSRFYNINSREWKDFCDYKINPGIYSDTPFLKVTADFFNNIIPIDFGRQRSLFNEFKKKNLVESVIAEITIRQASRTKRNQ